MMKYELVIIWETGEREIYEYNNLADAETGEINMKTVFGKQIAWIGIREKRR